MPYFQVGPQVKNSIYFQIKIYKFQQANLFKSINLPLRITNKYEHRNKTRGSYNSYSQKTQFKTLINSHDAPLPPKNKSLNIHIFFNYLNKNTMIGNI